MNRFCFVLVGYFLSFHTWSMTPCEHNPATPCIRYLGVGALDIRYQGERILTDPFYTPFSIWDIITLTPYKSNHEAIRTALGDYEKDVSAVLVGHGHYDHLADLPTIKTYLKDDALIIASPTSINMISSAFNMKHLMPIASEQVNQWLWIADGWIRIKPQYSEHAPQFASINLFPEEIHDAKAVLPEYIWQWKQGKNLTFLMDFLEAPFEPAKVKHRLFLQTSASSFPIGYQAIEDDIAVDSVWIAAASFHNVENYPAGLLTGYKPKQVHLMHWENFFKPWWDEPKALSLLDQEALNEDISKHFSGAFSYAQPGEYALWEIAEPLDTQ